MMNGFPGHWPAELVERLRYQRFMTSLDLQQMQSHYCRWCDRLITDSRRSVWCSSLCSDEFEIRRNSSVVTARVFERDHGICAVCGIPVDEIEALRLRHRHTKNGVTWMEDKRRWGPWYRYGSLWEADHIIPVAEGGGCCGLDNYRTLCLPCHKRDTAELAARLAQKRRQDAGQPVQGALV